jgi:hypothetical protein
LEDHWDLGFQQLPGRVRREEGKREERGEERGREGREERRGGEREGERREERREEREERRAGRGETGRRKRTLHLQHRHLIFPKRVQIFFNDGRSEFLFSVRQAYERIARSVRIGSNEIFSCEDRNFEIVFRHKVIYLQIRERGGRRGGGGGGAGGWVGGRKGGRREGGRREGGRRERGGR